MKNNKIIVHANLYQHGSMDGVVTTVVGQCDGLIRKGMRIEVWTFSPNIKLISRKEYDNGLVEFQLPRFRNHFLAAFAIPSDTRKWIRSRLSEVSIFHLHSVFTPQNIYLSKLGVPYVITPNGGWSPEVINGRNKLFKKLWIILFEKNLWSQAKFIQAVSHLEEKQLKNFENIGPIILIPNGVMLPNSNMNSPANNSEKSWLFLGRIAIEQKGLDIMIDAYARAFKKCPNLPKLILAGPDFRGSRRILEAYAKNLGIEDRIVFVGPLKAAEKTHAFQSASLFLHSSRWEGMPLAILEALSHGLPCLLSPETGLAEWVENQKCGWVAEATPEDFSEKMINIFSITKDFTIYSRNAKRAVSLDFSWDKICTKILECYLQK